jgi:hypothetical protein
MLARLRKLYLLARTWKWGSTKPPEICPVCTPWLLSPENVMALLSEAIVENSDLVCVGGRVLCKQTAVLAREAGRAEAESSLQLSG